MDDSIHVMQKASLHENISCWLGRNKRLTYLLMRLCLIAVFFSITNVSPARAELPTRAQEQTGSITITVKPEGASLRVTGLDGYDEGFEGSQVLTDLVPGRYVVTATMEGYEASEQEVDIEAGGTEAVELSLESTEVEPADPIELEVEPEEPAAVGTETGGAETGGAETGGAAVDVEVTNTIEEDAPTDIGRGTLEITVTPAAVSDTAIIEVTGPEGHRQRLIGQQTIRNLTPGSYALTATATGYIPNAATTQVTAGPPVQAQLNLIPANGPTDPTNGRSPWWDIFTPMLFSGLIVGGLFGYLIWAQHRHYSLITYGYDKGYDIGPRESAAIVKGQEFVNQTGTLVAADTPNAKPKTLQIQGPTIVSVGRHIKYKASSPDSTFTAQEIEDVIWTVTPDSAAVILGTSKGAEATIKVKTSGIFTLQATLEAIKIESRISATEEGVRPIVRIPWVGSGYGTLLIAVIVLGLAMSLVLLRILSAEAIATLFTAIIGFIFGRDVAPDRNRETGTVNNQPQNTGTSE